MLDLYAMIISFSPQLRGDTLTLNKQGDMLTINFVEIDFLLLESGTKLPSDVCQNYGPPWPRVITPRLSLWRWFEGHNHG